LAAPVLVVLALSGCGAPMLKTTIVAAPDLNRCGKVTGYPLTYRVLQVTDPSVLSGMSLTQLWNKESALLGPALLDRREFVVDPDQTVTVPVERKPGAVAMVVVGNFCRPRGSCWYHAQPLSQGKSVKLSAGADCFSATK
jgi:type VI secretion system VasD/TssJ family lipoprotein